ncbi:MAG TPA: YihY/virulence factor BrkB family protein [Acetobacteraceae bacterium]|nr:YihY/virulence factor BrkB family protein [Acetobacteraceae bacterium]
MAAIRAAVLPVARSLKSEIFSDHVLMVASGLAFYAMFGVLPALAAAAALLRLALGAAALEALSTTPEPVPAGAMPLLSQFLTSIPSGFGDGLILAVNLALVVVTAYQAAGGLITALNIVYDEVEQRGRLRRTGVALLVGLGGIALLFVGLAVIAAPLLVARGSTRVLVSELLWVRWIILSALLTGALLLVLTYAPSRQRPAWRRAACGAVAATVLWVAATYGVSFYAQRIGTLGRFYGSLSAVAILLLWFYATSFAVLIGGELDSILQARAEGRPPSRMKQELRRRERA